jgi:signal transduction histidine kinase
VLREGQVCWRITNEPLFRTLLKRSALLFFLALVLTGLCAWIAIRKFRRQNIEEERKRFALQTLTHELRTPLASLVVSSEEILDRFDQAPSEMQGTLVRMCDDIQRLHRLAQVSQHYLRSETGDGLVRFEYQAVQSLHAYLKSVLESFEGRIEVRLPAYDRAFTLDAHWVGVCIRNLLENALVHGAAPVRFRAELIDGELELSIEDAGTSQRSRLEDMVKPFAKDLGQARSSRGLGLGLAIVHRVAQAMSADLRFTPNPTRFTLLIREPKRVS